MPPKRVRRKNEIPIPDNLTVKNNTITITHISSLYHITDPCCSQGKKKKKIPTHTTTSIISFQKGKGKKNCRYNPNCLWGLGESRTGSKIKKKTLPFNPTEEIREDGAYIGLRVETFFLLSLFLILFLEFRCYLLYEYSLAGIFHEYFVSTGNL